MLPSMRVFLNAEDTEGVEEQMRASWVKLLHRSGCATEDQELRRRAVVKE